MAKEKDYGFKTPVRRATNNVTGNKVGGDLSGGECKIIQFNKIVLSVGTVKYNFDLNVDDALTLFKKDVSIAATGGYFLSTKNVNVTLSIALLGVKTSKSYILKEGLFEKFGLECEFDPNKTEPGSKVTVSIELTTSEIVEVSYTGFNFGFITYDYYYENDVYDHFYNSKKVICFPEQFYFSEEVILPNSVLGNAAVVKSCNRCQRFLPINHLNERIQLAFANHCSTKAPCTHGNFSAYTIKESYLNGADLEAFIKTTCFTLNAGGLVQSHFGHQLECKSCKKFFVNSALNHLRTSTQHREDGLRRRAFELLTRTLLNLKWIYHTFKEKTGLEFDEYIWNQFDRKCFNCDVDLPTSKDMDLDHTMPLSNLYPLDETATCLCPTCNSSKHDMFPIDFYKEDQLIRLAKITGIDINLLHSRKPNQAVVSLLKEESHLIWFFETFLTFAEYTKVREGKRAADSILHSLQKVINNSETPFKLVDEYEKSIST